MLFRSGLKTTSGVYKRLLDKDMSLPEDQAAVAQVLSDVRTNPNLADSTKQAIESVAMQAFNALATQQEMFGPRGGVLKGAESGRVQPRSVSEAGGAGVQVPSGPEGGVPTGGVGVPPATGMEGAEPVAIGPERGAAAQPGALKKGAPKKATPAKKAVVPIVPKESQDLGEQRNAIQIGRAHV